MFITFKSKHTFVLRKAQLLAAKIRRKVLLWGPSKNRPPYNGRSSGLIVATMDAAANFMMPSGGHA